MNKITEPQVGVLIYENFNGLALESLIREGVNVNTILKASDYSEAIDHARKYKNISFAIIDIDSAQGPIDKLIETLKEKSHSIKIYCVVKDTTEEELEKMVAYNMVKLEIEGVFTNYCLFELGKLIKEAL